MFVRTTNPAPIGSTVTFEFRLTDDFTLIKGEGVVTWVRALPDGEENPAGMGIQFDGVDAQSRGLISKMIDNYIREGGTPFNIADQPAATDNESSGAALGSIFDGDTESVEQATPAAPEPVPAPSPVAPAPAAALAPPPMGLPEPEAAAAGFEDDLTSPGTATDGPAGLAPMEFDDAGDADLFGASTPQGELFGGGEDAPVMGIDTSAGSGDESFPPVEDAFPSEDPYGQDILPPVDSAPDNALGTGMPTPSPAEAIGWAPGEPEPPAEAEPMGAPSFDSLGSEPVAAEPISAEPVAAEPIEEVAVPGSLLEAPGRYDAVGSSAPMTTEPMQMSPPGGGEAPIPTFGFAAEAEVTEPVPLPDFSGIKTEVVMPDPYTPELVPPEGETRPSSGRRKNRSIPVIPILGVLVIGALATGGFLYKDTLMAMIDGGDEPIEITQNQGTTDPVDPTTDPAPEPSPEVVEPSGDPTIDPTDSGPQLVDPVATTATDPVPTAIPEVGGSDEVALASLIESIAVDGGGGATTVDIVFDGVFAIDRAKPLQLESPPRYVLRLEGIDSPYQSATISAGTDSLTQVRFGYKAELSPPEQHIVLDLAADDVTITSRVVGRTLVLQLTR